MNCKFSVSNYFRHCVCIENDSEDKMLNFGNLKGIYSV